MAELAAFNLLQFGTITGGDRPCWFFPPIPAGARIVAISRDPAEHDIDPRMFRPKSYPTVFVELPDGTRSCGECAFWRPYRDRPDVGECRRAHPVVLLLGDGTTPTTHFPETYEGEDCGEFQRRSTGHGTREETKVQDVREGPAPL